MVAKSKISPSVRRVRQIIHKTRGRLLQYGRLLNNENYKEITFLLAGILGASKEAIELMGGGDDTQIKKI